jgi:hypothetical protein
MGGREFFLLGGRFSQRFDTLGAHDLLDQAAILENGHLLQIRLESSVGCALRK